MSREGLTRMTKIEVVVNGDDARHVADLLTSSGANGYTMLSGVSGLGHSGFHQGRLHFNDRDALKMLIAVVPDDSADDVVTGLRALLSERPGVLFVSDTYVSRPEYFT
ncbi:MAG TPA: P-II family nitrogen regulator [Acidimicrobiales bacterium]|nr:P-II family nitrogen regulator [Acidimicrobiales bacterium]